MKNNLLLGFGLFAAAARPAAAALPNDLAGFAGPAQDQAPSVPTPVSTPAPGPSAADLAPITTISQLLTRDGAALKALYQLSQPGAIPVGESEGMASVAPGTDEGEESR